MRPASLGRETVAKYPERTDPAQVLSFWSNFGAGQGWPGTRKRNRSNALDLICVQLEDTQYKILSAASGVAYEGACHLSRP